MVELNGESLVFFRVKPKYIERTINDLRRQSRVKSVELTIGPYDIVLTGDFRDFESLRNFAEKYSSNENIEAVSIQPSFNFWKRHETVEKPVHSWTFIHTSDMRRTFKELQKVPNVGCLYTTAGPYNLIVCMESSNVHELQTTLQERVRSLNGVRRTETLTSQPTP